MLAIVPELNVTFLLLRLLISFWEATWYGLSLLRASYLYNLMGLGCYFFCSEPASRLRDLHCHGWVQYIYTTKITVLRFDWDSLVSIQYIYYCGLFCLGPASHLCNHYHHVWVRNIDTTKVTVVCMSSLILSIDLQRLG